MLSTQTRRVIYVTLAITGVLVGAITTGYATDPGADPAWVAVMQSVFAFLAGPTGLLAALNTPSPDATREDDLSEG